MIWAVIVALGFLPGICWLVGNELRWRRRFKRLRAATLRDFDAMVAADESSTHP